MADTPISAETFQKLYDAGYVSKEQLDRVYSKFGAEATVEQDAKVQALADEITEGIETNPQLAQVAERVGQNLEPRGFTPQVPPIPEAVLRPQTQRAAVPTPTPAATVSSTPIPTQAPEPTGPTPEVEAGLSAGEAAETQAYITGQQSAQAAEQGDRGTALDLQMEALRQQRAGILAEAGAVAAGARQQVAVLGEAFKEADRLGKEQQDKRITYQTELDRLIGEQEKVINEYSSLTLDPSRYYARMNTADKIIAGIGILLGGIGKGMGGGENKAYDAIKQAIKDDLDLQKAQIEVMGDALGKKQNLLSTVRARVSDQMQAEQLSQNIMLNRVKLQLEAIAAQTKSQEVQARAQQGIAKINADLAKSLSTTTGILEGRAMDVAGALSGDIEMLPPKTRERVLPGIGLISSPQEKRKLSDQQGAYLGLKSTIQKIRALREKHDIELFPSQERQKAETLHSLGAGQIKDYLKLGAYDWGVRDLWDSIVPKDPLGGGVTGAVGNMIWGDRFLAKIEEFEKQLERGWIKNVIPSLTQAAPEFRAKLRAMQLEDEGTEITDTAD